MALTVLADVSDVETAGRLLAEDERGYAEHVLRMAAALVRADIVALDERIAKGDLDPELVRDVVVAITKRALNNPDNARGRSRTAGPFTEYTQWDADAVGIAMLPVERRVLAPRRRSGAKGFGSLRLGAGLGFPSNDTARPTPPPPTGGAVRP